MHARKVQVKNGRLVLDEPTDLPDGAEVEVLVIDDELTVEERAELHASLDRALEDSQAGRWVDAEEYLQRHRAGGLALTTGEAAELDRRWNDHVQRPESAIPWNEVRRKLLDRD